MKKLLVLLGLVGAIAAYVHAECIPCKGRNFRGSNKDATAFCREKFPNVVCSETNEGVLGLCKDGCVKYCYCSQGLNPINKLWVPE